MRDLKHLPNDLRIMFAGAHDDVKRRVADQALEAAKDNAPKLEPFLMDQGYAFIDGNFYKKSGSKTSGHRRSAGQPDGGYSESVTIVFKSMRSTFDYAYYLGRVNPGWLRFAETQFWIESSFNPEMVKPIIAQVLRERWT